jgi:hypothetical protein
MAFWADIDPEYLLRFQEWHNCEHIPERVSIPGFNVGRRYRLSGGAPRTLMFYETDGPEVLKSDAYLAALNRPTPWTKESLQHFRNPERNIYRLVVSAGRAPRLDAPYLMTIRFDLAEATGDSDRAWLAEVWAPAIARLRLVSRVRLYQVDRNISGIMTSERSIYGGGPGQEQFLLFIECRAPECWRTPIWIAAEGRLFSARPDPRLGVRPESFWLEIAYRAPRRRAATRPKAGAPPPTAG